MGKGLPYSSSRAGQTTAAKVDLGTPAGTGVSMSESRSGAQVRSVVLSLKNVAVPLVDEAGVVAYGSLKVLDLPAGLIVFLGAVMDLALTKSSAGVDAAWDGDVGLGTAAAGNNNALATTEQDLVPTTPTPQAVSGATTADAKSTSTEGCKLLDGTSTAKDVFLNLLVDDTDHDVTATPCNLIVNGTIKMSYLVLGDI